MRQAGMGLPGLVDDVEGDRVVLRVGEGRVPRNVCRRSTDRRALLKPSPWLPSVDIFPTGI